MVSGLAGAGLVLLVVGVLAVTAGLGMLVTAQDDAATADTSFEPSQDRSDGHPRTATMGQTIAVGGGAIAFLGLIFIVIGRAD